jgi:hypothetical protein
MKLTSIYAEFLSVRSGLLPPLVHATQVVRYLARALPIPYEASLPIVNSVKRLGQVSKGNEDLEER